MIDWGHPWQENVYMEREITFRDDDYMLEVTAIWQMFGPLDEYYCRPELCSPVFEFTIFQYNELTQNYEIPIVDFTAEENFELQHKIKDWYWDYCAGQAEDAYERRRER